MAIARADVGCWIVKCNPTTGTDYFGTLDDWSRPGTSSSQLHPDSWCLSPRSGRSALVREGDLVALWVTGPKNPGIYEYGWVTDNRIDVAASRKLHYEAARLGRGDHIPRSLLQATPSLARCEQLRAPMISNPSYLTPDEAKALAQLIAARQPGELVTATGWDTLL